MTKNDYRELLTVTKQDLERAVNETTSLSLGLSLALERLSEEGWRGELTAMREAAAVVGSTNKVLHAEAERLRAENAELRAANKTLLNQLGWFVNREGYVLDVLGADAKSLPIRVSVLSMRMREKPMPGAGT